MWWIEYEDYKSDEPLIKDQVAPTQGIIGCEMHDLNGWGLEYHDYEPPKPGHFRHMIDLIFGLSNDK